MNAERLLAHYERVADAPDAIARLRRFILDLAVRGKLVPQDPQDEPASELLKRIAKEKARLVKAGEVRRDQPLPMVDQGYFPMNAPIGWALTRLAAISRRIHYGFTASADADLKDVRMLRITDIQDNAVDWSSVPGCVIDADKVDQYKLEKGDILIARTAIPSALLSPPPESAARPPRPHGVLADEALAFRRQVVSEHVAVTDDRDLGFRIAHQDPSGEYHGRHDGF
jgi:hypothetical protein